jgi:hypothetical protein
MSDDQLFIEQREQGDYAIRRGDSERASAVLPTQAEAIARAREMNPGSRPWWSGYGILLKAIVTNGVNRRRGTGHRHRCWHAISAVANSWNLSQGPLFSCRRSGEASKARN